MKLDILVLAAHPDDAELACSGTIASHVAAGKKVGVVDFTRGEMGTRGTPETRQEEANESSKILGISVRENLEFEDIFFKNTRKYQVDIVRVIRKFQPEIILANAVSDRHPDHGRAAKLVQEAYFISGLKKIETEIDGVLQQPWRPKAVYHYIQSNFITPDFIVDVSPFWDKKVASIKAFKSQFYDPSSEEPQTFISTPEFFHFIEARAIEFGHAIGVKYGEGFTVNRYTGVRSLFDLL